MSETELNLSQHEQAVKLHNKIMASASLAQQSLWEMCKNLKEMRDSKLYKALGYKNFEDYCEKEVGMKRRNVYNYISIVEKINTENVQPVAQIGIKKLSLLATLSSEQQTEVAEKVNLEETTYKDLKAEIDKLKQENKAYADRYSDVIEENGKLKHTCLEVTTERNRLEKENEELRNRPIDVAVVDRPIENDPKFKEIVRSLERENMKRNEELEQQYREDEKAVRKMLEKEKQQALSELREEYEKKLSEQPKTEPVDEDKLKFKIYLTSTFDMLNRLTEFTSQHNDPIYKEKIKQLLNSVLAKMED